MSWLSSIFVASFTVTLGSTDSSSKVLKMHQFHATFIISFSDSRDVDKDIFEDVTDDSWK